MTNYVAPLPGMEFVLLDLLGVDAVDAIEGFDDVGADLIKPVLEETARFIEDNIAPLNRTGDEQGCHYQEGWVSTAEGFKEAYQTFSESGWIGLAQDPDFGGQGLPHVLGVPVSEMLCSANTAFSLFPGLSRGVYETIHLNASDELKQRFLSKLGSGEWCGTMCISEPQAGSDIGAIRCKAERCDDGDYRLNGSKIWITGGEHNLTEQIIHLVLARTPGAPDGVHGLSLFAVPKRQLLADGSLGGSNDVSCAGIEHKMGIHASPTCVLNFDDAIGYLIGDLHNGIRCMFTVMNFERFEIALQGLGIAEHATQNAIRYAQERKQGYGLDKDAPRVPVEIIHHPDIKRVLMTMKAYTEGMRMLAYSTGLHFDAAKRHQDMQQRQVAQDQLDLMIPVCKALFTDLGVEIASLGVQVFGGNGYVREYGMEQNLRDARIGPIYEGTNAIQALDLVRRKLLMHDGRLPRRFFGEVETFLAEIKSDSALGFISSPLASAQKQLEEATAWMQMSAGPDPELVALGASGYLRAFGLVVLGYWWARAAHIVKDRQDQFSRAKLATVRFYAESLMLHQVQVLLEIVMHPSDIDVELI